jgi:hypothetical protein
MYRKVLAVFTGTDFDENVFKKGLETARHHNAVLCLACVRNEGRTERLRAGLWDLSILGTRMVEETASAVGEIRGRAIGRALAVLADRARAEGVPSEWRMAEGEYVASVRLLLEGVQADAVVVPKSVALALVGIESEILTA